MQILAEEHANGRVLLDRKRKRTPPRELDPNSDSELDQLAIDSRPPGDVSRKVLLPYVEVVVVRKRAPPSPTKVPVPLQDVVSDAAPSPSPASKTIQRKRSRPAMPREERLARRRTKAADLRQKLFDARQVKKDANLRQRVAAMGRAGAEGHVEGCQEEEEEEETRSLAYDGADGIGDGGTDDDSSSANGGDAEDETEEEKDVDDPAMEDDTEEESDDGRLSSGCPTLRLVDRMDVSSDENE